MEMASAVNMATNKADLTKDVTIWPYGKSEAVLTAAPGYADEKQSAAKASGAEHECQVEV